MFWIFFGFFIVFLGFISIITGFIQMATAEDIVFLIQIEEMLFVQDTISKESIIFMGLFRFLIGVFFVIIGNSFLLRGDMLDEKFHHPRMGDFKNMRFS